MTYVETQSNLQLIGKKKCVWRLHTLPSDIDITATSQNLFKHNLKLFSFEQSFNAFMITAVTYSVKPL